MENIVSDGFLSNMGSNAATLALVGVGYFIYKFCFKSRCHYSKKDGFELDFDGGDSEDDEDEHLREMYKLLIKRKSMKLQKKKTILEIPAGLEMPKMVRQTADMMVEV